MTSTLCDWPIRKNRLWKFSKALSVVKFFDVTDHRGNFVYQTIIFIYLFFEDWLPEILSLVIQMYEKGLLRAPRNIRQIVVNTASNLRNELINP